MNDTERIHHQYNPAGFWIRLGANILDGLIIGIPLSLFLNLLLSNQTAIESTSSIIEILYYIIVPVIWTGYTIGKKIIGIRICKMNGGNVTFGTMFMRVVIGQGIITLVTLGIAVIVSAFMIGLREDKRGIHDFVAGTYVRK